MARRTGQIITQEELERYLPNPVRRSGKELRTWLEPSRSKTHISIDLEDQVYYDFHTNRGGSLVSLLRQQGVPMPRELAESNLQISYKRQLAILAGFRSRERTYGCGLRTAVKTNLRTGLVSRAVRVMCLRWDCFRCAPFLKRVWMERVAGLHFGAIYHVPKGYKGVGKALNRVKQRARRADGKFEWLLLQSNECQILFVASRSNPKVKDWLENEPYFERVALMPTIDERNRWLEKGLERMTEPMNWTHKVRHSKELLDSDVDDVSNTQGEYITSSTEDIEAIELVAKFPLASIADRVHRADGKVDAMDLLRFHILCRRFSHYWEIRAKPLEELVTELESQGYAPDWLTGDIVNLIPPEGEG